MSLQTELATAKQAMETSQITVRDLEARINAAMPHLSLWKRVEQLTANFDAQAAADFAAIKAEALSLLGLDDTD